MRLWVAAALLCVGLLSGVFSLDAQAISFSEDVELTVPQTTLTISGRAAPNSLVTITEDGNTIATASSSSAGDYSTTIIRSSGIHEVEISYRDPANVLSRVSTRSVSVAPQQNTNLSVFLAPTLTKATASELSINSVVQLRGYSYPGSEIELSVDGGVKRYKTSANTLGRYEFLLDAKTFGEGGHSFVTTAKFGGDTSEVSRAANVLITTESNAATGTPDIVVRPNQLPPPISSSPEDGTTLDGNSVVIKGESAPFAQVNIYTNGELYGTISADSNGQWSFLYTATVSPVTFVFEACVDSRCSVLSKSLTLRFLGVEQGEVCLVDFKLLKYRYWGVSPDQPIGIDILESPGDGVLSIEWGDGDIERFDHDSSRPNQITKSYFYPGTYNVVVTFSQDGCEAVRYVSVIVTQESGAESEGYWAIVILMLLLAPFSYYVNSRSNRMSE